MVESTLPEGFEDFFDDYDMKYPQVEKDYADYEDDDFEWDDWFQGQ